jgi:hypothetical protein
LTQVDTVYLLGPEPPLLDESHLMKDGSDGIGRGEFEEDIVWVGT